MFDSENSDKLEHREESGGIVYAVSFISFRSKAFIEHLLYVSAVQGEGAISCTSVKGQSTSPALLTRTVCERHKLSG